MTHTHDMFFCFDEKYVKFDTKYSIPTFVHKKMEKTVTRWELKAKILFKFFSR